MPDDELYKSVKNMTYGGIAIGLIIGFGLGAAAVGLML